MSKDFFDMECFFWCNFFNIFFGLCGLYLFGIKGYCGIENLGLFSFVIYIGVIFLYFGFIMWFFMVFCYFYYYMKVQGVFILNMVYEDILLVVYQSLVNYLIEEFEFVVVGFMFFYLEQFNVFYVKESFIKIGLEYVEDYYLKLNDMFFVVGKIVEVIVLDDVVVESGYIEYNQL